MSKKMSHDSYKENVLSSLKKHSKNQLAEVLNPSNGKIHEKINPEIRSPENLINTTSCH